MTHVDIVDALSDTEHRLNWSRFFGPISGHDAKLENPRERYLITTFCYGCNLGPTQTARSIKGLDRRQVSFVNQRHVTEENLNQAITRVINAYAQLPLQLPCRSRPAQLDLQRFCAGSPPAAVTAVANVVFRHQVLRIQFPLRTIRRGGFARAPERKPARILLVYRAH